jgi:hypothetical protein
MNDGLRNFILILLTVSILSLVFGRSIRAILITNLVTLLGLALFSAYLVSIYSWDRDHWNKTTIATAYVEYYKARNKFPSSIKELVEAKLLPASSSIYTEPPGLRGIISDFFPPNYKDSSYVVMPPPNGDVNNLQMLGRRVTENNTENLEFDFSPNSEIRDNVLSIQSWRGVN